MSVEFTDIAYNHYLKIDEYFSDGDIYGVR